MSTQTTNRRLLAALRKIANTRANGNSDPDVMAKALNACVITASKALEGTRMPTPGLEVNNRVRAEWAWAAIEAFMGETWQSCEAEALGDLVVDLLHLRDRTDMSEHIHFQNDTAQKFLRRCLEVYREEVKEEKA